MDGTEKLICGVCGGRVSRMTDPGGFPWMRAILMKAGVPVGVELLPFHRRCWKESHPTQEPWICRWDQPLPDIEADGRVENEMCAEHIELMARVIREEGLEEYCDAAGASKVLARQIMEGVRYAGAPAFDGCPFCVKRANIKGGAQAAFRQAMREIKHQVMLAGKMQK